MYHILTLNELAQKGLDQFPNSSYQVGNDIQDPDVIILRSANIKGLGITPSLKAIGRSGAGTDNIPIERLSELGIPVFNTPGANANAVKELVIACLVIGSRQIGAAWDFVRSLNEPDEKLAKTVEESKKRFQGFEVQGRILGVVGLGSVGRAVANAAIGLGMEVLGFDPGLTVAGALQLSASVVRSRSLEELLRQADFLTVHVPLNHGTIGLIDKESLELTKNGVVVLNFSRDGIVNDQDMKSALETGKVAAFLSDFPSNLLKNQEHVFMLPHLGASTSEAEENCTITVVNQVREYLETGNIHNSVNFPDAYLPRFTKHRLVLAHANVPNMIGQISEALGQSGINISDMINMSKGVLAYTIVDLDTLIPHKVLQKMAAIPGVLRLREIEKD